MTVVSEKALAVLLPVKTLSVATPSRGLPRALVLSGICIALLMWRVHPVSAQTSALDAASSVVAILTAWTPAILQGFFVNIYISILSMLLATALGTLVGVGLISEHRSIRGLCWGFTQFFRNAPWLVVLFYAMLLLPFSVRIGNFSLPLPDWSKAVLAIAIAAAANMAEIVRGAIQSLPTGQWESASSLGFRRRQIIWMIVLPQCVRRMTPGWMNLYALVVVSTPLCSIVGVREVMTSVTDMLASHGRHDLLMPAYFYILVLFFSFCFPIARLTQRLERRFAVAG
jgi:polar amino acid transport system permease protein